MNILTDEEMKQIHADTFGKGVQSFARAIEATVLSKLAKQNMEPVAYTCNYEFYRLKPCSSINGQTVIPLYTETQLLAAQQRTAEACAKVCSMEAWAVDAMDSIRNGDWREYL